jgi:Heparinase II/III-like protein/Heparinase II/III N-terminus
MLRAPLSFYIRRLGDGPVQAVPQRLLRGAKRLIEEALRERKSRRTAGFAPDPASPARLNSLAGQLADGTATAHALGGSDIADKAVAGCFNLLGSGWITARHGARVAGFEGHVYPASPAQHLPEVPLSEEAEARRIWAFLDADHIPIDWHRDLRSGFRWDPKVWCKSIRYGQAPGVDVKWPWELGRLQHLPLLALRAIATREEASARPYARALRNQVLDFIASNPPGYGVQWACTMDVAIRAANMLLAVDLLRSTAFPLDEAAEAIVARSALEHGRHILTHVEWDPRLRGNHYLCNLAGLAFCATYLPAAAETDAWLAYAAANLMREAEGQFDAQGCNFEASTSYHRLSTEALIYGAAALSRVASERWTKIAANAHPALADVRGWSPALSASVKPWAAGIPEILLGRIAGAAEVTARLITENGHVPQIGDNDSGRFMKLEPVLVANGEREDVLDHRHLLAAAGGLLGRGDLLASAAPFAVDASVVAALAGRSRSAATAASARPKFSALPGLGIYVWRRPLFTLFLRCGPNGQNGRGGHAHNDQMSIELWVRGQPVFVDPGTYVYTPAPERRNEFRATAAHNTLAIEGREQNRFVPGSLFALQDDARSVIIAADENQFEGEHYGFGVPHRRSVRVMDECIEVTDTCGVAEEKWLNFTLAPSKRALERRGDRVAVGGDWPEAAVEAGSAVNWGEAETLYSPGYGVVTLTHRLHARFETSRLVWRVTVR